MTLLVLDPTVVAQKEFGKEAETLPKLDVTDSRDDYNVSDGDGIWIGVYLDFLADRIRLLGMGKDFFFSDSSTLDEETFEEVSSPFLRGLMVEFTSRYYEEWKDEAVTLPDWEDARRDCRNFCDDCDVGWEIVRGTYEGPWADEVEADEDVSDPKLGEAELAERRERNRERQRERERREAAQEEAESEEVDRNFICDDECDAFQERIDEQFREGVEVDVDSLKTKWQEFLAEKGLRQMPALWP